ncbi:hypothetical protein [Pectobacterium atrosepticum]|nr:hypothetical protein [Pectobacterium atrosepticum]GKV85659.1 hypothetical protein PEC301296_19710 [Pectobacterium carotovorum subsp. carotovorum]AIK12490.1 Alcohol dehydrogenase zinc-binding domain protein [Pectobacterium atrosepticum]MCA6979355.1 hypothetical protein [Pectobacterium atrosepticum]MDK9442926.1 hypothetical protein [Pectobacterium atrosepticum]POW27250.1 NADP-dependent oxidoreductase [Pectobacterium atrosepticum]
MNPLTNKLIVLAHHPDGPAQLENFRFEERQINALQSGEYIVENKWLSIDQYTRTRLSKIRPLLALSSRDRLFKEKQ